MFKYKMKGLAYTVILNKKEVQAIITALRYDLNENGHNQLKDDLQFEFQKLIEP